MNGFLIIGRCTYDDVPLRLFGGEKEARDYAAAVTAEEVRDAAFALFGADAEPVCLSLMKFSGGVPQRTQELKVF